MNALIIAANNHENLDWVSKVKDWQPYLNTVYQPKGREADTYLHWICDGNKQDEQVFCQGNPFTHDPDFLHHLDDPEVRYYGKVEECNAEAAPHYTAPLHLFCKEFGLPTPDTFRFVAGAQYRVTREQLEHVPWSTYRDMLKMVEKEQKGPWIMERLWPLVWNIKL